MMLRGQMSRCGAEFQILSARSALYFLSHVESGLATIRARSTLHAKTRAKIVTRFSASRSPRCLAT